MTRTITFAGPLEPGDCYADGDLIGIDRKPRDRMGDLITAIRQLPGFGPGTEAMLADYAATLPAAPPAYRSPRPARTVTVGWSSALAGTGLEDIPGTGEFARLAADFEPDRDLEAWSLPVTDPWFDFLITPAEVP